MTISNKSLKRIEKIANYSVIPQLCFAFNNTFSASTHLSTMRESAWRAFICRFLNMV